MRRTVGGGASSPPPHLPVSCFVCFACLGVAVSSITKQSTPWPVSFTDIAERAGLRDPVVYGGLDRKRFIIETNGAGVALVDYDRDGWLDALVLSGTTLKEGTREETAYPSGRGPRTTSIAIGTTARFKM